MLGANTKCNLSFDKADIDYTVLVNELKRHFIRLTKELRKETSQYIDYYDPTITNNHSVSWYVSNGYRDLTNLINSMNKTAELLHTIENVPTRKQINFVNKPEIKEEK